MFKNIFQQKEEISKELFEIHEHIIKNGLDASTFDKHKKL